MDSTAQNNASIVSALIDDVIIMVFECLDVVDILRIRQTCKYLAALTQSKQLWSHILFRTVIKRNIPLLPYTRSFQVLSSTEVEIVASHALRLRKQTIAPPQLRRQLVLSLDQSRSVSWLQLVRGQWLLAAFSDTQTSIIRIWSVMDLLSNFGKSSPVAEAYLEAPVASGMVQTRDDQLYIALYLRGSEPSIDVLTLFTCDERLAFSCVAHFPGAAHLRCFDEDWIGYALHHEISVPSLLNWNTGDFIHLRKTPDMRGGCIAMARWNDYVAVINPISLELYRRDDQSYCLWGEVDLPCPVGFAEFALADSAEHLTFCLSCERGVFVYQVVFELPHDTPQLKLVWTYRPKQYELSRPYICKPRFGVTQRTLTWIDTPIL
ncbi:unnamed protein product [Somion occarium]|uniref:F-box domain-containing protein n=1 Tax=Somion occarium TaxID=3059160 RepID=A0ABP1E2Q2_9APHY